MKTVFILLSFMLLAGYSNAQSFPNMLGKSRSEIHKDMSRLEMYKDESGFGYDDTENATYLTYKPTNGDDFTSAKVYFDSNNVCYSITYFFYKKNIQLVVNALNKNFIKSGDGIWSDKRANILCWLEYKKSNDLSSLEYRLTDHPYDKETDIAFRRLLNVNKN